MNTTRAITEVLSSQLKKKLFIQPLITPRCSLSTKSSTSSSSSSMQPKIKDGSRRMKRREVEDTLWKDLVENPNQWWDNRNNKIHPKGPDFMHKDSWKGLWLNVAPKWVDMLNLEELEFRRRKGVTARSREFLESLWKNLVEKPTQWMDNRKIKSHPDYPDFMHKDSGEGLWLNRAPKWLFLINPNELEFQPPKDNLVRDKEFKEILWKDLVLKPNQWQDNRKNKVSLRSPDFMHKDSEIGLWLDTSPKWVLSKLEELEDTMTKTGESLESSWTDLFTKPSQWQDHRNDKLTGLRSSKCPDFTHMVSGEGLWLNTVPKWALNKNLGLQGKFERQ